MLRPSAGLLALCFCGAAFAADPPAKTLYAGSATNAINHYITEGWKAADIKKAADKAPDLEFLRRVFIDLGELGNGLLGMQQRTGQRQQGGGNGHSE